MKNFLDENGGGSYCRMYASFGKRLCRRQD